MSSKVRESYLRGRRPPLFFPRRLKLLLFLLGVSLLSYIYIGGDYGFLQIFSLHSQVQTLRMEIKRGMVRKADLARKIELISQDSTYMRKYIREEMGMAKKGEKIYWFKEVR